jgi:putative addiction module killer protein
MVVVQEYVDEGGYSPFREWFDSLNGQAAIKVTVALERIAAGHTSSAMKALGEGVSEYKIDFGPGYRIYFGRDGERLVILVGGGTKKRQQQDIARAKAVWNDYKRRRD